MKKIYIVRHGQTEGNRLSKFVTPQEPLNETGFKQAKVLAERVKNLEIDKLFVSDFARAQQTIAPIQEAKGIEPEIHSCFGEARIPDYIVGLDYDSEVSLESKELFLGSFTNDGWDYEKEGESLYDLFQRANQARTLLETSEFDSCLLVSHAFFIKTLLSTILTKFNEPNKTWLDMINTFQINNTGITYLTFDESAGWRVVMYNDHAHFAE